jgi:hypothetical protein
VTRRASTFTRRLSWGHARNAIELIFMGIQRRRMTAMRAFLLAAIVTVVLAVAASYALESIQKPTELANATPSVRIDRE